MSMWRGRRANGREEKADGDNQSRSLHGHRHHHDGNNSCVAVTCGTEQVLLQNC